MVPLNLGFSSDSLYSSLGPSTIVHPPPKGPGFNAIVKRENY